MARGLNKAMIIGNLGAEPETRYMPSGTAVVNLNVATTDTWRDKQTGEQRERTEWHKVVLFARLAEIAAEYLKKGSKIYIEGSLKTRKWQDRNGNDRYTTEIIASDLQMLDSKNGSQPSSNRSGGGNYGDWREQDHNPNQQQAASAGPESVNLDTDFDDDVPF
jgi:single-strand DNA-binding protein